MMIVTSGTLMIMRILSSVYSLLNSKNGSTSLEPSMVTVIRPYDRCHCIVALVHHTHHPTGYMSLRCACTHTSAILIGLVYSIISMSVLVYIIMRYSAPHLLPDGILPHSASTTHPGWCGPK